MLSERETVNMIAINILSFVVCATVWGTTVLLGGPSWAGWLGGAGCAFIFTNTAILKDVIKRE